MTSIAPWLSVDDADAAVAFYLEAFGAVELERMEVDGHVVVAQLTVDGAEFWVQADDEVTPEVIAASAVRMILSVDDPDAALARALAAGATEVAGIHEEHGWRTGRIADPTGFHWEFSRPVGD